LHSGINKRSRATLFTISAPEIGGPGLLSTPRQHYRLSRDGFSPRTRSILYGVYELQTLENVPSNENPDAIITVAQTIKMKRGLPDDGDDYGFLSRALKRD
jgi:hypothetical protein